MSERFTVARDGTPRTDVLRGDGGTVITLPTERTTVVQVGSGARGGRGPEGPEGPEGPRGPSAADASYVHEQSFASTVWTIFHELGAYPAVTVIDSLGDLCFGAPVYLDDDTVRLTFSAAISGVAYLS